MVKVFFLDIDDCLIKTSALTDEHLSVIKKSLSYFGIQNAEEITREFASSFHRLYDEHQGKELNNKDKELLNFYMQRLTELEKPVLEKFGEVKRWSREVCLFIAGEKSGIQLSNEILLDCANSLWQKIAELAVFYPDAKNFLNMLIRKKMPFYLITSSDSRLIKDDQTGLFHYDPDYSRNLKLKRLRKFLDLGIPQNHIFIGDPVDKPKTAVFEEALNTAKKEVLSPFESVMVSDSVSNDLIPAEKVGMKKLVFLKRHPLITPISSIYPIILSSLDTLLG